MRRPHPPAAAWPACLHPGTAGQGWNADSGRMGGPYESTLRARARVQPLAAAACPADGIQALLGRQPLAGSCRQGLAHAGARLARFVSTGWVCFAVCVAVVRAQSTNKQGGCSALRGHRPPVSVASTALTEGPMVMTSLVPAPARTSCGGVHVRHSSMPTSRKTCCFALPTWLRRGGRKRELWRVTEGASPAYGNVRTLAIAD